ncbi:MAG: hypothetical protein U0M02_13925 [Acutalibacteraceae bacterium]|nr:hypothetical protein [Acutalibacteraceae bacterium]
MTDKRLKRANDIKTELSKLRLLKDSLNKRVVTIDLAFFENLREPFIDVIEGKIAELEAEFKKL